MKCDKCGVETYMPFRCNYCGGYFCEQHRLPEFHDCKGGYAEAKPAVQVGSYSSSGGFSGNYSTSRVIRPYWFSRTELRDIVIGLLVIVTLPTFKIWSYFPIARALGIVSVLTLAFILHELAHKFAAQRYGMWAEFRLNTTGLLLTFVSFVLLQTSTLPLMILAPGAVMIAGLLNVKEYGKISIAGPATNIAQALIYFAVYLVTPFSLWGFIASYGMMINSFLSLFNLIPFGVFDGLKIFRWDRRAWAAAVVASGAFLVYTLFFTPF